MPLKSNKNHRPISLRRLKSKQAKKIRRTNKKLSNFSYSLMNGTQILQRSLMKVKRKRHQFNENFEIVKSELKRWRQKSNRRVKKLAEYKLKMKTTGTLQVMRLRLA